MTNAKLDHYPSAGSILMTFTYLAGLPFLIVGLLLTRKKKVWQCATCGYYYDRA